MNYEGIPSNIVKAITDSNDTRKDHIATMIVEGKLERVENYRLTMKTGTDISAIQGVINE